MPQDQDDIKGADAMKQAPTPGPLSGDDVKLLVKGDVISHPKWGVSTYLPDTNERPAGLVGPWSFIGRPDADGWMPWSGGENPVPGRVVEVRRRNELTKIDHADHFGADWRHDDVSMDIIAFRLAPTAPVEASGSEREEDALEALDWIENVFPGQGDTNDQGVTVRGWHRLDQACATIRAVLSRPQPSGETRDVVRLKVANAMLEYAPLDRSEKFSERTKHLGLISNEVTDAILALLSARPLALGGQHSGGDDEGGDDDLSSLIARAKAWSCDPYDKAIIDELVAALTIRNGGPQ